MTPVNPTSTPSLGITLSASSSTLRWQPGQVLTATVAEVQGDGKLRLQLLGQLVEARSLLPLAKGQQLQVLVEVEANRVMLRLLEPNSTETALSQAWRNILPRQQPLITVLQALARLAQVLPAPPSQPSTQAASAASTPPLPPGSAAPAPAAPGTAATTADKATAAGTTTPPLPELAKQVLQRLTPLQQLATVDGLRRALLNAGPLLESRLAQGDSAALDEDFQATLLRLLGLLKPERSAVAAGTAAKPAGTAQQLSSALLLELGEHLEGGVARIKTQQLHSLGTQASADPAWLFELPLRNQQNEPEVLRLRIQREAAKGENGRSGWSVRLHFDDATHGGYDSVVTFSGGKVGVSFWSERQDTSHLFTQRMEELRARLQQNGLDIEHLHSSVGRAPTDDTAPPSGLLSIKA